MGAIGANEATGATGAMGATGASGTAADADEADERLEPIDTTGAIGTTGAVGATGGVWLGRAVLWRTGECEACFSGTFCGCFEACDLFNTGLIDALKTGSSSLSLSLSWPALAGEGEGRGAVLGLGPPAELVDPARTLRPLGWILGANLREDLSAIEISKSTPVLKPI